MTFLCVTTTAVGARVEPEVYCSRAVLVCGVSAEWKAGAVSRSSASISITAGGEPGSPWAHETTSSTTADVVSTATGELSLSAAETRSSSAPDSGTDNGTAMKPASIAPRTPTMYSRPCGARIATRSPDDPQDASSAATTCARRWT